MAGETGWQQSIAVQPLVAHNDVWGWTSFSRTSTPTCYASLLLLIHIGDNNVFAQSDDYVVDIRIIYTT